MIFVTALPPYPQLSGSAVTAIATRALRRAGVIVPRPGAHLFRHTTALLQAGVDMATIALWLGHERLETTHQYVEADLQLLASGNMCNTPRGKRDHVPACRPWCRSVPRLLGGSSYLGRHTPPVIRGHSPTDECGSAFREGGYDVERG